ncbi:GTP-binding protein [Dehalobacterium formicoaceticum]|uniref:CobW family GTP-binding protein n=1 Tax=Dehalobacterium formicoaceticum TaxID=51515 RepID=UPI0031F5F778
MVRLDIVSGFLGAGKTTFIKKIIEACIERREKIVLIENEYGQINVDGALLKDQDIEIHELLQGCVCCTLKEEFAFTLQKILQQKPDRIIFEPSGIFIFDEIFNLFKDPKIAEQCYINSVTTIVDAPNFHQNNNSFTRFFDNQIQHASTLVLSKTQNMAPAAIEEIVQLLKEKNNRAPCIAKEWGDISHQEMMLILDGNTKYALKNYLEEMSEDHHVHEPHVFQSVGIRTGRIFEQTELEEILGQLSTAQYGKILRGKGIVNARENCWEFNIVNGAYQIDKISSTTSGIASFIGLDLKKEKLQSLFVKADPFLMFP